MFHQTKLILTWICQRVEFYYMECNSVSDRKQQDLYQAPCKMATIAMYTKFKSYTITIQQVFHINITVELIVAAEENTVPTMLPKTQ